MKAPSQSSALSLQYRPTCNSSFFVTYDLENAQIVPKVHSLRLRSRLYQDTYSQGNGWPTVGLNDTRRSIHQQPMPLV